MSFIIDPYKFNQGYSQPCSYLFDGTNEYIGFGDILDSVLAGSAATFTISLTILLNTTTAAAEKTLLSKWTGSGNQRQFRIFFDTSRRIALTTSSTGSTVTMGVRTDALYSSLIDWYTIDITFNGALTGSTNVMSIFVNGVEEAITSTTNSSKTIFSSSAALRAATTFNSSNVADLFYDGYINQINIWNSVLSDANILDKYNSGRPKDPATYSGLIGSWIGSGDSFSSNWTVVDRSGAGNNGTSVNMEVGDKICA